MLGLGNSLVQTGLISTALASEYSISLDGTGDYLSFTETVFPISTNGDNLSISFWAKRDGTGTEDTVLSNVNNSFRRLTFEDDGAGLLIESDTNGHSTVGDVTADTNWHHYVVTVSGNDDAESTVLLFEDGEIVGDDTNHQFGITNGVEFTINAIGFPDATNNLGFDGLLYQIAMFDTVLSAPAVNAMYNSGTPIPLQTNKGSYTAQNSLLHLWRFSENTGTSTADDIGGLTATFAGNTAFNTGIPTDDV